MDCRRVRRHSLPILKPIQLPSPCYANTLLRGLAGLVFLAAADFTDRPMNSEFSNHCRCWDQYMFGTVRSNAMKAISLTRPVLGLIDTVRASLSIIATRRLADYREVRPSLRDEDELRSLSRETLRDIGIDFSPPQHSPLAVDNLEAEKPSTPVVLINSLPVELEKHRARVRRSDRSAQSAWIPGSFGDPF
jgi:hypothetical protein